MMENIMRHRSSFDFACGARRLWTTPGWENNISELDPISYLSTVLEKISFEPINIDRATGKQRLSNYSFIGNFGVISVEAFLNSGGFDEDFNGWGYEDADLMQELLCTGSRFLFLRNLNITCFHLSHHTDKKNVKKNINLYNKKCQFREKIFHINHLFGVFEEDGYSLIS